MGKNYAADCEQAARWLRDIRDGVLQDKEWPDIEEFIEEHLGSESQPKGGDAE